MIRAGAVLFPLVGVIACAPTQTATTSRTPGAQPLPRTRAERSGYTETSTHADVVAFLDSLKAVAGPLAAGNIGTTSEGRTIPYVIASRPLFDSPEAARRSGRPIVYVQGNIHGGEVEGKEALQALLRDLVLEARPNALDSIILIAVPIYNADGNDAWGPQGRQRTEQNGPETVGLRPNADTLDLNGIDRWWGGTWLHGMDRWRYDRDEMRLVSPNAKGS